MADSASAGWRPDPTGRHQLRYHDGTVFTGYVCDDGAVGVDEHRAPTYPGPAGIGGPPPPAGTGAWPAPTPVLTQAPAPSSDGWSVVPWPPAAAAAGHRRFGLPLAIVIAVLEAVAIVALGIALIANRSATSSRPIGSVVPPTGSYPSTRGTIVYSSTFGGDDNWMTGTIDSNTAASVSDGHYVVRASARYHHVLLMPYGDPHLGISVRADVSDFPSDNISMGVGCQSDSGVDPPLVYQLVVYPDGGWWVEEARLSGSIAVLTSGQTSPLATTATFQLTCVITQVSSAQETTQLVAFVNGTQVAAIGDQITHLSPGGYVPAIVVGTFGSHVHVAFSGVVVRSVVSSSAGESPVAPPQFSVHLPTSPPGAGPASPGHRRSL